MATMFNELAFRIAIMQKGKKLSDIAQVLGISNVTLYRKMSGESDFFRAEIDKCGDIVGKENISQIFFADKVN